MYQLSARLFEQLKFRKSNSFHRTRIFSIIKIISRERSENRKEEEELFLQLRFNGEYHGPLSGADRLGPKGNSQEAKESS